ncbi:MAG: hypothetical protein F6K19_50480 [Cyanothece sp. SIO1E1]|nr:hypothetical protein [Cyanothece sp. SIO1E1]
MSNQLKSSPLVLLVGGVIIVPGIINMINKPPRNYGYVEQASLASASLSGQIRVYLVMDPFLALRLKVL